CHGSRSSRQNKRERERVMPGRGGAARRSGSSMTIKIRQTADGVRRATRQAGAADSDTQRTIHTARSCLLALEHRARLSSAIWRFLSPTQPRPRSRTFCHTDCTCYR
ncbi:hypothetical protein BaRGS_00005493, partial [Batillaria attramentaria]